MVSMRNKKNYPSIIIKYSSYLELCITSLFKVSGTLSGKATLPLSFLNPFSTKANSTRKEYAPLGANSFL